MTSTRPVRRFLALGVALAAATTGGLSAAAATPAGPARAMAGMTTVTFKAPNCEGCTMGVYSISPDGQSGWGAGPSNVVNGLVSFKVPKSRTHGMVAVIDAPWDGKLGYTTTVVLRYNGKSAGDTVGVTRAINSDRGSSCWAGTTSDAVTIPLTIRQIVVAGTSDTPGTLAFARVTKHWWAPMMKTHEGVVRAKTSIICHKP